MIPMKNTNVTPSEMPAIFTLPSAMPIAHISDTITMACSDECSINSRFIQSIALQLD